MTSNISKKIKTTLSKEQLEYIKQIAFHSQKEHFSLYLVGGIIRDLFLNSPINDFDITVVGNAINLAKNIANNSQTNLKTHERFITATLSWDDFSCDLVTARSEIYSTEGALPIVTPATIQLDLLRRDFSINAIACSINQNDFGSVIDPINGINDINNKLIRILHPKSFLDDPTRIIRALRYAAKFQFQFENETANKLQAAIEKKKLELISKERIRNELWKTFREKKSLEIIGFFQQYKIFEDIFPPLQNINFSKINNLVAKKNITIDTILDYIGYSLKNIECMDFIKKLNLNKNLKNRLLNINTIKEYEKNGTSTTKLRSILNRLKLNITSIENLISFSAKNTKVKTEILKYYQELKQTLCQ